MKVQVGEGEKMGGKKDVRRKKRERTGMITLGGLS